MRRSPLRRFFVAMGRATSWHRRKLAVGATLAAVLLGVGAFLPPPPPTVSVLRAGRALPGGTSISTDDVSIVPVPSALVPVGAVTDADDAIGRITSGDVASGQLLSTTDLAHSRARLSGGRVLAPIRLADEQVVGLLSEGMTVDVLAADEQSAEARVIAAAARIAVIPPASADAVREPDGRLILVEVSPAVANALARSAVVSRLSVVWR